jgi:polysaccharide export outer membrane protein
MFSKYCILFSLIFAILFLSHCSSTKYAAKTPPTVDLSVKKKAERLNEVIMMTASTRANTEGDYRIGSGDLLEIEAYNVEDVSKTVRVNSQGDIALPLIGIVKAKGVTISDLEQAIAHKLERYVQETVVNVSIKEYCSQRISVLGAVNNPQLYAVNGQRYLIDMLMMAGGLREDAGNICYVIRPARNSSDNHTETLVIDLNELLINGNFDLNIPVFAGDIINVPRSGVIFVDGSVRNPGAFNLKGGATLMQAIAMAQGLGPGASTHDIRIFRDNGKGERDVIRVDYDAIKSGEKPDILLAENDVIIVPQSSVKNFFNGFMSTVRGFISFGAIPLF